MDHPTVMAALLATPFAASLLPLSIRLLPVISQIAKLIVAFRTAELSPLGLPPLRDATAGRPPRTGTDHRRVDL
jgi:hypothetical protein